MPISDASQYLWNVAPSVAVGATIHTGAGPIDGMLLRAHTGATTTATFAVQESVDGTNWTIVPQGNLGAAQAIIADTGTEQRIFWTGPYLRVEVTAASGAGILNIGLVHGKFPRPPEGEDY